MIFKTTMTATAIAALIAGGAIAGTDETEDMTVMPDINAAATMPAAAWDGMSVGDIIGMSVRTEGGDDVGEIDYIIVQDGQPAGVIGVGGFLGLGEYTVALPLSSFSMGDGEGELIRDLVMSKTAAQLKAMPEIDESELNAVDDDVMLSDVIANPATYAMTGMDAAPTTVAETGSDESIMATPGLATADADIGAQTTEEDEVLITADMTPLAERTVDDVIGLTVVDTRNRVVGEIDYIVNSHDTVAAVIGIGGFLGLGEYTVSLPMENFELTAENRLEINMTETELKALPEIDESEIESIDGERRIGDVI